MPGKRPTAAELRAKLARVQTKLGLLQQAHTSVVLAQDRAAAVEPTGDRAVDSRAKKADRELAGAERALRTAIVVYSKAEDALEYRIANPW